MSSSVHVGFREWPTLSAACCGTLDVKKVMDLDAIHVKAGVAGIKIQRKECYNTCTTFNLFLYCNTI